VTTVVMLFGSRPVAKRREEVVVPTPPMPPVDAAVPMVVVDAAPEVETMEVTIVTDPPGAIVQVDGVEKGPSPVTVKLVVDNHFTEVVASAPGHDDKAIKFNTYVDKNTRYPIKLRKTPQGAAPLNLKGPPGGKQPPPRDRPRSNPDLQGNPFEADSKKQ
jgi:hypothetical protein